MQTAELDIVDAPEAQARVSILTTQIARYLVTGGVGFVVDVGILVLLTEWCGVHYLVSAPAAFAISLFVTYLLCATWVFSVRQMQSPHVEFAVYAAIGVIGLGINQLVIWAVVEVANGDYLTGKLGSTFVVLVWNFTARRTLLFG